MTPDGRQRLNWLPRALLFCVCAFLSRLPAHAAAPAPAPIELSAIWPKAQEGDPAAEVKVGNMYESGRGTARDYAEAAKWYRKAADQGDVSGQLALGALYFKGHGVPRDYAQAAALFEEPANQGLAQAQYYLGWLYEHGQGVRFQDFTKAAEWLTRSANQDNADAQNDMGDLCFNGQGAGQSYEDAYFWYLLAGNHKLARAEQKKVQKNLARTKPLLTPLQLESAQTRAREWKPVMETQGTAAIKNH